MEPIKPKRVALYARVSTEEQADRGYSIEGQKEKIHQYCELYDYKVVDEYVDAGISGKDIIKRPQVQRLLADAEKGKFDEVAVWKINRISRNTKDFLEIFERLEKYNVSMRSLTENFDTSTPMGKFAVQMLAAVGELERNTIVENVSLGLNQRAMLGLHSGSRALGYGVVPSATRPNKNDLVIIEKEAVIIRKIFELFCNGKGFKAIANQLNKEGYKTVKGNAFGLSSIREIIDNPLYKGYVRYGKYRQWSEKRRRGKSLNPILVKGVHEPIVSEEIWDRAERIRAQRAYNNGKVHDSKNILSSLLKCPVCGAPMVIGRSTTKLKNGEKRVYRYYCCSNFKNKGSSVCHSNSVGADEAEQYVLDKVAEFLNNPELIKDILAKVNTKSEEAVLGTKREIMGIEAKIAEIEERKKRLLDLYIDGRYDKANLDKRLGELNDEAMNLLNQKKILDGNSSMSSNEVDFEYIKELLTNFKAIMESAPQEQTQLLLRLLIDKITVKNNKVDKLYMKFGIELQDYLNNKSSQVNGGIFLFNGKVDKKKWLLRLEI